MKKIIILFVLTLSVVLLSRCGEDAFKKEITPPKKYVEPQLVVHSYIAKDLQIQVSITLSKPIFGIQKNGTELVKNAKVIISNVAKESVILPYNEQSESYVMASQSFPIVQGQKYYLEVETPDGKKVSADCVVPMPLKTKIENVRLLKVKESGDVGYRLAFDFEDKQGEQNYYMASSKFVVDVNSNGRYKNFKFDAFSDFSHDGETIHVRSQPIFSSLPEIKEVVITLYSLDKYSYMYHRTTAKQEENKDLGFFVEPVIISSNIKNGLGIFGAYSVLYVVKRLE